MLTEQNPFIKHRDPRQDQKPPQQQQSQNQQPQQQQRPPQQHQQQHQQQQRPPQQHQPQPQQQRPPQQHQQQQRPPQQHQQQHQYQQKPTHPYDDPKYQEKISKRKKAKESSLKKNLEFFKKRGIIGGLRKLRQHEKKKKEIVGRADQKSLAQYRAEKEATQRAHKHTADMEKYETDLETATMKIDRLKDMLKQPKKRSWIDRLMKRDPNQKVKDRLSQEEARAKAAREGLAGLNAKAEQARRDRERARQLHNKYARLASHLRHRSQTKSERLFTSRKRDKVESLVLHMLAKHNLMEEFLVLYS